MLIGKKMWPIPSKNSLVSEARKHHDIEQVDLMVSGILTVLFRFVAFASVALAIYVVVGTLMFPAWWHGLFFSRSQRNGRNVVDGLQYVWHSRLAFNIAVVCVFAIAVGAILKRWLFPPTDMFAGQIVITACVVIVVDALLLYLDQKVPSRRVMSSVASVNRAVNAFHRLGPPVIPPKIESLVYFIYLDDKRVDALYSQIQPELQERERTVGGSSAVRGETRAGSSGFNIAGNVEKATESKTTYVRSEFSINRKCVELMRYVSDKWPGSYYSSELHWYSRRGWKDIEDQWKEMY